MNKELERETKIRRDGANNTRAEVKIMSDEIKVSKLELYPVNKELARQPKIMRGVANNTMVELKITRDKFKVSN